MNITASIKTFEVENCNLFVWKRSNDTGIISNTKYIFYSPMKYKHYNT